MSETITADRPVKRSVTLSGHRTSVSLEQVFWDEFQRLAVARGVSTNALVSDLDAARTPPASLASAIRVFVLTEVKAGR
ncbi:MAG: ribbon-helix-helix domain-containing protein [Pseudomonadota bacterium]